MWRAIIVVVVACLTIWKVQDWRYGEQLASQSSAFQSDLTRIATAGADQMRRTLERQQHAQQALADIDRKESQERSNALGENKRLQEKYTASVADNSRLRAAVLVGYDRLRIAGSCDAGGGSVSSAASTAGMGDGAAIELAPAAGRSVFDIREGIIRDQSALRTLQVYVKAVCQ